MRILSNSTVRILINCTHFLWGVRKLYQNRYSHTKTYGRATPCRMFLRRTHRIRTRGAKRSYARLKPFASNYTSACVWVLIPLSSTIKEPSPQNLTNLHFIFKNKSDNIEIYNGKIRYFLKNF